MKKRPYILTIAGFDPSNGAGFTADIKTFEALKCYGLSVCTANTIQNDVEFINCHWTSIEIIKAQIGILYKRFKINVVKIGIIENWKTMSDIIDFLLELNPKIKIVVDPILKSSTDFEFQSDFNSTIFDEMLSKIYLITPNYQEIENLFPNKTIKETIKHIQSKKNLFLKGGHNLEELGVDYLYANNKVHKINPKNINFSEKHGSGCVLSAAIASYIALKYPLLKSCFKGKRYVEKILSSNKTLLGYH